MLGYKGRLPCSNGNFVQSLREAAKPPPQPTHKVAVHIPSQKNFDSDSEIEEVRRRVICLLWQPTWVLFSFMDNLLSFSFYLHLSCVPIQLTEVKTIPTPAPRGEKVSSATHSRIWLVTQRFSPRIASEGKAGRRRVAWRVETFHFPFTWWISYDPLGPAWSFNPPNPHPSPLSLPFPFLFTYS